MGAVYLYMQECSVHSLICLLFKWVQCQSLKPVLSQCSQTGFVTVDDFTDLYTQSYIFHSHDCNVLICKNVFYTRCYHFYSHGCDVFTSKNVLYTSSYVFYSHVCNVRVWNLFWASVAKPVLWQLMILLPVHLLRSPLFSWVQCIYTCKNVFYTHWYHLCSMGVMYLHARMFCTLAHMPSIPMGAMYLYMQERFLQSLIRSYTHCGHQILPW